ncbi:MAG: extracellular solute-binding protein, partial [Alphaproteobacteria bacterium]|nr:extracellular solute-binding protein [Alphaproteobacteria bacterium]
RALGGLAALSLAFTASPPVAAAETTLTMWTFLNPTAGTPRDKALKRIIDEFEAANPDIRIKVESQVWFTLAEKFVMAHRSRSAPDIGWVNGENMGLLINAGVAADLGPLITDKWPDAIRKDLILPQAYDWLKQGGKQHAVPIMALSLVLFYREDLFREAGIDPASVKTWDDFAVAARKMQKESGGRVERWGAGLHLSTDKTTMSFAANALIGAQGGRLFGDGCKAILANPDGVRAIDMQADLIRKHKVASPESFAQTLDDVIEQFIAGKVAMASSGNGRFGNIEQKAAWNKAELGILPWPSLDGKKPGPQLMSGWFAAISKDSTKKEAAAKFVDYMTGQDGMTAWTELGGLVPLFKSVFAKPQFQGPGYLWVRRLAEMWAAAEVWLPANCNASRTFVDLNTATQRVVLGNVPTLDALKEAEAATAARQ